MVNYRLVYVLETRGLYSQHQAGFRRYRSTLDQMSHLEVYVQNAFMRREHVLAVFFDLEKAYDTTWRHAILRKCHDWGLRGNMPRFLRGFLESRRFRVRLGSVLSDPHVLENGIPQGSVLSVTLFTMAINSLADVVADPLQISLYVDDLAIYLSGRDLCEVGESLQQAVDRVAAEASRNGFKFSKLKTVCLHFCRLRHDHAPPTLILDGTPIHYKDSVRFLGLIFDSKLSWQEHIEYTSTKARRTLDILKFLGSYKWGTEREILKRIFICLTRSKLEYGAPVYSSARKSRLALLDRVYNEGIRLFTGAFRTSPLQSLYVESGMLPPQLRREQITLTYTAGIWGKRFLTLFPTIFESLHDEEFRYQRSRTRPLSIRAKEILAAEGIELGEVMGWGFAPHPPWLLPSARVRMDLAIFKKDDTPPVVYRQRLLELMSVYYDSRPVFTDGSKTDNGVGSAVYTDGVTLSWTLPYYASVYTAEAYALCQALKLIKDKDYNKSLVLTDSLSAIMALRDQFSTDPMVVTILKLLFDLRARGQGVTFVWVPGHIGVSGNERADQAAKQAASTTSEDVIPVRPTDLQAYMKLIINRKWQVQWDNTNEKLKDIRPRVLNAKVENYPRHESVILTRLRIGHTRLTHGQQRSAATFKLETGKKEM
ncbi:uncharacterized protein [Rhodnius prolixus]|uniref:uncharacterized protein n=1 Tax=Rhodnius prolixus TaxID=13249 RepID=UPI003D1878C2